VSVYLCGIKKTFSWFGFDLYEYLCVVTETFLGWLIKKSVDHVFAQRPSLPTS